MKILCRLLGHKKIVDIPLILHQTGGGEVTVANLKCERCGFVFEQLEPLRPIWDSEGNWTQRLGEIPYNEYLELKAKEKIDNDNKMKDGIQ